MLSWYLENNKKKISEKTESSRVEADAPVKQINSPKTSQLDGLRTSETPSIFPLVKTSNTTTENPPLGK